MNRLSNAARKLMDELAFHVSVQNGRFKPTKHTETLLQEVGEAIKETETTEADFRELNLQNMIAVVPIDTGRCFYGTCTRKDKHWHVFDSTGLMVAILERKST